MSRYKRFVLHEDFTIKKLVTFHYTELTRDYVHSGEKHDFWEFLYLDKGEAVISTDHDTFHLKQGDLIFYSPNEFHSLRTNNKIAPNILIVSFECDAPAMRHFIGRMFRLDSHQRALLAVVLREGLNAFDPPVDRQAGRGLHRRIPPPFGCEQMIKIHLEALLISLVRKEIGMKLELRLPFAADDGSGRELTRRITEFLQANLSANLTMDEISRHFNMAKTTLRTIFKQETGFGIMEYYGILKIEQAKKLIREETYSFTEISERLGYSSIHYFSRSFKRITDMTPSEYARSIKAKVAGTGTRTGAESPLLADGS